MASSYRFTVSGRVQGVGFRYSAASAARQLTVRGWVRNLPDGRVEGVAQGGAPALAQFREWLERGPPAAEVAAVQWDATTVDETLSGFSVRR
jgi:acylphosphatase